MISKREMIDSEVQNILVNEEDYNFCLFLKKLREAFSLSQKKVAEDLGIGYYQYYYWESGEFYRSRWPTQENIQRLCQYYELPSSLLNKKLTEMQEPYRERGVL